jgi:hypothetical protein
MTIRSTALAKLTPSWERHASPLVIGKDILDLISTSMYVNPITIYREYVQNSADAIDELRTCEDGSKETGRVDIAIDAGHRRIRITDNGSGIKARLFEERLTSFGASAKRGTLARGFRGVGRLCGLGYCQELIFRSRAAGESAISEMRWDCRRIKESLRSSDFGTSLQDVVNSAVEIRTIVGKELPERFFEVELLGIVRHKNDALLNPDVVNSYLSQVAPVPFSPTFRFGEQIIEALHAVKQIGNLEIRISGLADRVYRPHRDSIEVNGEAFDHFAELEVVTIPSLDGGTGAMGWILHHNYKGAIPAPELRGLRVRTGNIQIGGNDLFQDNFPESRFNSWTVGEIHTLDNRIVPNGRRDHFEQDVHFHNLTNHVTPVARAITGRCRRSSIVRNVLRDFDRSAELARQRLQTVRQGGIGAREQKQILLLTQDTISKMTRLASREVLEESTRSRLKRVVKSLQGSLARAQHQHRSAKPLRTLPPAKRRAYQDIFKLIYECSNSHTSAHVLVERILGRLI